MKKSYLKVIVIWGILSICALSLFGCGKNIKNKQIEGFITTAINCETYKTTEEADVKTVLIPFFTEDGYAAYKHNDFLYLYPELFDFFKVTSVDIDKISCTKKEESNYTFQVNYKLNTTTGKMEMVDHISIALDETGKIDQAIILNTSDSVKKMYIDIKIQ